MMEHFPIDAPTPRNSAQRTQLVEIKRPSHKQYHFQSFASQRFHCSSNHILLAVIWIVLSHARMRSVTNYFIVNLSIADTLNATLNVIPNFIYMLTGNWPFGRSLHIVSDSTFTVLSRCMESWQLYSLPVFAHFK